MRHPSAADIPLTLDRSARTPLSEQLVAQVRELVARGALRAGDPLPSTRGLAQRLGVSRGTVTTAWDTLSGEGYLTADRGATRIAQGVRVPPVAGSRDRPERPTSRPGASPRPTSRQASRAASAARAPSRPGPGPRATRRRAEQIDLRPGRAPITELDTPAWRRAWRDAAGGVAASEDQAPLVQHLREYLRVSRGVVREPHEIVVTAGARDGLHLVLSVLASLRGRRLRVAVEDPGYPALRHVVEAAGHAVVPVAVDELGLDPANLPTGEWGGLGTWDIAETPDAVVVTPGHQYPLGGTMPVSRRLELLRWARAHRAVVIEDDYDSDLRYTGQPLPALAALDTDRTSVVTLGSFTKVLGGGVGVGHLVAPDDLLPRVQALRDELGSPVSQVAQRAVALFMESGHLQRHTVRMRRAYRRRRSLIAPALADLTGVTVIPMAGGSHAVVEVPDEVSAVEDAAARGVLVSGLGEYWAASTARHPRAGNGTRTPEPRAGLVLGLTASDEQLTQGVQVLGAVLRSPRRAGGEH